MGRDLARVVTINLWGDREPLAARLTTIAEGLSQLSPDVVLVQEVRRGDGLRCTAETLAEMMGGVWRAEVGVATSGPAGTWGPGSGAGEEGLAILTPHPLRGARVCELPEARPLERRVLLSATLDVRGAALHVHTTHLHWRLGDGLAREAQVVAVDELVRAFAPSGVHVIAGDFNAAPECDEMRFLFGWHTLAGRRAVWQDAWATLHPAAAGWTWAKRNPHTAWLEHLKLERRIDYVLVSPEQRGGLGKVLEARVVLDAPGKNGVWPSDHFGVLADVVIAV